MLLLNKKKKIHKLNSWMELETRPPVEPINFWPYCSPGVEFFFFYKLWKNLVVNIRGCSGEDMNRHVAMLEENVQEDFIGFPQVWSHILLSLTAYSLLDFLCLSLSLSVNSTNSTLLNGTLDLSQEKPHQNTIHSDNQMQYNQWNFKQILHKTVGMQTDFWFRCQMLR